MFRLIIGDISISLFSFDPWFTLPSLHILLVTCNLGCYLEGNRIYTLRYVSCEVISIIRWGCHGSNRPKMYIRHHRRSDGYQGD
jgi:hypothetical protein